MRLQLLYSFRQGSFDIHFNDEVAAQTITAHDKYFFHSVFLSVNNGLNRLAYHRHLTIGVTLLIAKDFSQFANHRDMFISGTSA